MMERARYLIVLCAIVLVGVACQKMCPCPGSAKGSSCRLPPGMASDIALDLELVDAKSDDGIVVRAAITNRGQSPHSLSVCPAMTICCVRDLHVMVGYAESGMGLYDVCKEKNPTPHSVFLPSGATFSFNMTIPVECLPKKALAKGMPITLQLCYDVDDDTQVSSPEIEVALP